REGIAGRRFPGGVLPAGVALAIEEQLPSRFLLLGCEPIVRRCHAGRGHDADPQQFSHGSIVHHLIYDVQVIQMPDASVIKSKGGFYWSPYVSTTGLCCTIRCRFQRLPAWKKSFTVNLRCRVG